MSAYLSKAELADLTGFVRRSKQLNWLRERRWTHEVGGDGYPRVLRAYRDGRMGAQPANAPRAAPSFTHLRLVK